MCKASMASEDAATATGTHRRRKLKEIAGQWHCTIIGTCLTLNDLKDLAAKMKIGRPTDASDYALHSAMVHLASKEGPVAKALHRLLDRRHVRAINKTRLIADEDGLSSFWREALACGEVAGACWALMSHPAANESLRSTIFGDIHMLSHRLSAAGRAERQQIQALTKNTGELEAKLADLRERLQSQQRKHEIETRALRRQLDAETTKARRLADAQTGQPCLDGLAAELDKERLHRRGAEEALRMALAQAEENNCIQERLRVENETLAEENRAFGFRLAAAGIGDGLGDCSAECSGICEKRMDLCGRCILVVGGRHQHLPHLRRLVEGANGVFAHHDGGLEESMNRLKSLCGRADAVLLPVDCVSHSAQDEVKRLCRRWEKAFVPVRRSGLGAYISALESLAGAVSAPV